MEQMCKMMNYKFELDSFQKECYEKIINNENVLVTAHTGSGKTVVAELAIAKNILDGKKILYTSPIKSLSNEKYKDFKNKFENNPKMSDYKNKIGLLTGDMKINPDGNIIIMTTEILRIILYSGSTNELNLEEVGCVIFDEVHYINNEQRGTVWEETIMLLDKNIQLVMLSATIKNAQNFANWLTNIKSKQMNLISTQKRAVPLKSYIYINNQVHLIVDENEKYYDTNVKTAFDEYNEIKKKYTNSNIFFIQKLVNFLIEKDMCPCTIFTFSRNNCERLALSIENQLTTSEEQIEIGQIFDFYMHEYENLFIKIKNYQLIKRLLIKGIGFHHSGIVPMLKEIIEILYEKGFVKVLFATETFAVGINKPIRTVVFLEIEKYTDGKRRYLYTDEFKQMMGRAGRRGIDTSGNVILVPQINDEFYELNLLKKLFLGEMPEIKSKLIVDGSFLLKTLHFEKEKYDIFIKKSLSQQENEKQIKMLIVEKDNYEKQIKLLNVDKKNLEKYKNLIDKQNMLGSLSFSAKQTKEINKKINGFPNAKSLKMYIDLENKISELEMTITQSNLVSNNDTYNAFRFLSAANYIETFENKLTIKGIIGAHINDCNCFIMTEIIVREIFDDMSSEEIVGFLSIFLDDKKEISLYEIETDNIRIKITKVLDIIHEFKIIEEQLHYFGNDWTIYYDFVDTAYRWASGFIISDEEYDGNFVRNMLKINNMVENLIKICEINLKFELIDKLQKINSLIIRDFVLNLSLYV